MMASCRHSLLDGLKGPGRRDGVGWRRRTGTVSGHGVWVWRTVLADEQAHLAPGLVFVQTVEGMTGRHTAFASRASIQVNLEGVLFARPWRVQRNELPIRVGRRRAGRAIVPSGELLDRVELPLLEKERVDQGCE